MPILTRTLQENKRYHEFIDSNVIDIDTARNLKEWNNKSFGTPKTMILSFHTITHQAQNALLKVFEEPNIDTQFILITSHLHGLLPTVRSRLHIISPQEDVISNPLVSLFLKTKPEHRIELPEIEALLSATDTSDRKDREEVQKFLAALYEVCVREKIDVELCKEIASFVVFASDPSSSGKMMLEYVSLRLPLIVV